MEAEALLEGSRYHRRWRGADELVQAGPDQDYICLLDHAGHIKQLLRAMTPGLLATTMRGGARPAATNRTSILTFAIRAYVDYH